MRFRIHSLEEKSDIMYDAFVIAWHFQNSDFMLSM